MKGKNKEREGSGEEYWVRVEVSIVVKDGEEYGHLEFMGDEVLVTEVKGLDQNTGGGPGEYVYASFRVIGDRVRFMEGVAERLLAKGKEIERELSEGIMF